MRVVHPLKIITSRHIQWHVTSIKDDFILLFNVECVYDRATIHTNDDSRQEEQRNTYQSTFVAYRKHNFYRIIFIYYLDASITLVNRMTSSNDEEIPVSSAVTSWSRIRSSCESNLSQIAPLTSEISTSPAYYHGSIRQEDIQMANDGRYFLLIDENITREGTPLSHTTTMTAATTATTMTTTTTNTNTNTTTTTTTDSSSSTSGSALILPLCSSDRKPLVHRLVFPERLGRILFYRRTLSDSDIYQKLCSKDNEIDHNVYHLDTIRDYSMEFYMLSTYASDSQLRAWFDHDDDDYEHGTYYFDDNRFQSSEDDDDDDDDDDNDDDQVEHMNRILRDRLTSCDSVIHDDDAHRLQIDDELDWYSELESFNLLPYNQSQVETKNSSY
jgi:hypothetical protein